MIETIKVKPWGKDQGDHVVINADDFDPKVHSLIEGEKAPQPADPFDHDGDGEPGGSLPGVAKPAPKPRAKKKAKK